MEDVKLQVLNEHYNATFDILWVYVKRRDRLFTIIIALLAIMLFRVYTPIEASNLIIEQIKLRLQIEKSISFIYIESIIWFSLLASLIRYFQAMVYIERQYSYLHLLEDKLSAEYVDEVFTREGHSYLSNYPKLLNWASFLYTILFPVMLALVPLMKISTEFQLYGPKEPLVWFNALVFVFAMISLVLYLFGIHRKRDAESEA